MKIGHHEVSWSEGDKRRKTDEPDVHVLNTPEAYATCMDPSASKTPSIIITANVADEAQNGDAGVDNNHSSTNAESECRTNATQLPNVDTLPQVGEDDDGVLDSPDQSNAADAKTKEPAKPTYGFSERRCICTELKCLLANLGGRSSAPVEMPLSPYLIAIWKDMETFVNSDGTAGANYMRIVPITTAEHGDSVQTCLGFANLDMAVDAMETIKTSAEYVTMAFPTAMLI